MKHFVSLFIFYLLPLLAEDISLLSYFQLSDFPISLKSLEERGYTLKPYQYNIDGCLQTAFSPETKKIFVMGNWAPASQIAQMPKEKLVLFIWEAQWEPKERSYYNLFSRVYTYNAAIVDNKKIFQLHYPCLLPKQNNWLPFCEKKLCTMVVSVWKPERNNVVRFFDTKPQGEFEYYGNPSVSQKNYRGPIPGMWRSQEKLATLAKYRFCVCFENRQDQKNYITEKIFCCFAAGCIPIYWGAPNITEHIPNSCFIDYRDFSSLEKLYQFLKNMSEATYQHYLNEIENYLQSERAFPFSSEHFNEILLEAITH